MLNWPLHKRLLRPLSTAMGTRILLLWRDRPPQALPLLLHQLPVVAAAAALTPSGMSP